MFSFPFLLSRFTEFGAGVEDVVSNHTEMGHDISLHSMEVKDEGEEALLHIQAHGQACASSLTWCQCLTLPGRAPMPKDSLSLCSEITSHSLFSSHPSALALSSAVLHLFFPGFLVSYFLMTMQSFFGWEIPREKARCYLRKIMKSILNERTGENPSTKLH